MSAQNQYNNMQRSGRQSGNRSANQRGPMGNSASRRNFSRTPSDAQTMNSGVYKNDRFMHAASSLIGCNSKVKVLNGNEYEGILATYSPHMDVVQRMAHQSYFIDQPTNSVNGNFPGKKELVDNLIFKWSDIACIEIPDVDPDYAVLDSFTDSAISRNNGQNGQVQKQLELWDSGSDGPQLPDQFGELEDKNSNGWDVNEMFEANKQKFNIKSDYDPSLTQYTVPLIKHDTEEFKKYEAHAEAMAKAIESSSNYQERTGLEDGDEEDAFSAVHRNTEANPQNNNSTGKYVPPHLRPSTPRGASPAQRPQQLSVSSTSESPKVLPQQPPQPVHAVVLQPEPTNSVVVIPAAPTNLSNVAVLDSHQNVPVVHHERPADVEVVMPQNSQINVGQQQQQLQQQQLQQLQQQLQQPPPQPQHRPAPAPVTETLVDRATLSSAPAAMKITDTPKSALVTELKEFRDNFKLSAGDAKHQQTPQGAPSQNLPIGASPANTMQNEEEEAQKRKDKENKSSLNPEATEFKPRSLVDTPVATHQVPPKPPTVASPPNQMFQTPVQQQQPQQQQQQQQQQPPQQQQHQQQQQPQTQQLYFYQPSLVGMPQNIPRNQTLLQVQQQPKRVTVSAVNARQAEINGPPQANVMTGAPLTIQGGIPIGQTQMVITPVNQSMMVPPYAAYHQGIQGVRMVMPQQVMFDPASVIQQMNPQQMFLPQVMQFGPGHQQHGTPASMMGPSGHPHQGGHGQQQNNAGHSAQVPTSGNGTPTPVHIQFGSSQPMAINNMPTTSGTPQPVHIYSGPTGNIAMSHHPGHIQNPTSPIIYAQGNMQFAAPFAHQQQGISYGQAPPSGQQAVNQPPPTANMNHPQAQMMVHPGHNLPQMMMTNQQPNAGGQMGTPQFVTLQGGMPQGPPNMTPQHPQMFLNLQPMQQQGMQTPYQHGQ